MTQAEILVKLWDLYNQKITVWASSKPARLDKLEKMIAEILDEH